MGKQTTPVLWPYAMVVRLFGKEDRVELGDHLRGIYRFQDDSERAMLSRTGNDCRVVIFGARRSLSSLFRCNKSSVVVGDVRVRVRVVGGELVTRRGFHRHIRRFHPGYQVSVEL